MSKQVVIVAPGLKDGQGHELGYTAAVAKAFQKRGYAVKVLCAQNPHPMVSSLEGFVPTFRRTDREPGRFGPPWEFFRLSLMLLKDLQRVARSQYVKEADIVFAHTITYPAFASWVWAWIMYSKLMPKTVLMFRYSLQLDHPSRFRPLRRTMLPLVYRLLFWLLERPPSKPRLVVDSVDLQQEYHRYTRLPIAVVPIPLDMKTTANDSGGGNGAPSLGPAIVLLYLGDVRRGKGFDLLAPLAESFSSSSFAHARMVVHCGRVQERYDEPGIADAFERLKKLESTGKVRLINGHISDNEYRELLKQTDIVLLPYRREFYMGQTSNVLVEAFVMGKPVVAPAGTWLASQVEQTGAGTVFQSGDDKSFAQAVREAVDHLPQYTAAARAAKDEWASYHTARRLIEELEAV